MAMGIGNTVMCRLSKALSCALSPLPGPARLHCRAGRAALPILYRVNPHYEPKDASWAPGAGAVALADGLGTATNYCGRDVPCVGPVIAQADLGLMARGARGSVNRALKSWQRAGWLVVKDRAILIADRAVLEAIAIEGDV